MDHDEERSLSLGTELSASVPPPSPLTGCYLLAVIGEPHTAQHKEIILQRLVKAQNRKLLVIGPSQGAPPHSVFVRPHPAATGFLSKIVVRSEGVPRQTSPPVLRPAYITTLS
ncbi:unnamed protein product [Plutella xylostella]|uniref:(diamondback moth) hypothetical protein n=1 Tax=Plutella xylostella TaxID=51655 RepID=A0A8S4EL60_PLUXY|nr:unnamed protein product [Plutella xylostella]